MVSAVLRKVYSFRSTEAITINRSENMASWISGRVILNPGKEQQISRVILNPGKEQQISL
jgi:hypothetical protein